MALIVIDGDGIMGAADVSPDVFAVILEGVIRAFLIDGPKSRPCGKGNLAVYKGGLFTFDVPRDFLSFGFAAHGDHAGSVRAGDYEALACIDIAYGIDFGKGSYLIAGATASGRTAARWSTGTRGNRRAGTNGG